MIRGSGSRTSARARELLGWEPRVPLAEGLVKTIEYFRGQMLSREQDGAVRQNHA